MSICLFLFSLFYFFMSPSAGTALWGINQMFLNWIEIISSPEVLFKKKKKKKEERKKENP